MREELTASQWDQEVLQHPYGDLLQLRGWAESKKPDWRRREVVIRDEDGEIEGLAQILLRRLPFPFSRWTLAYAPRGPVVDPANSRGIERLLEKMEEEARAGSALLLRLDPPWRREDWEGSVFSTFSRRGYRHAGFGQQMEEIQPRYNMVLDLEAEPTYNASTRNQVNRARRQAFRMDYLAVEEEHDDFYAIMVETGKRDGIGVRNQAYYENLHRAFPEADFAVLSLDREAALHQMEEEKKKSQLELQREEKRLQRLEGEKRERMLHSIVPRREGIQNLDEQMETLRSEEKPFLPLACAAVLYCGPHAYYLYGGSSDHYRRTFPVYALLPALFQRARERGCRSFDFGGVSGQTDPSRDPSYGGLYFFKRQWGAQMVEYVGEFEKPLRPFLAALLRTAIAWRKRLRKPKRK